MSSSSKQWYQPISPHSVTTQKTNTDSNLYVYTSADIIKGEMSNAYKDSDGNPIFPGYNTT
jgi:hypothetical protein